MSDLRLKALEEEIAYLRKMLEEYIQDKKVEIHYHYYYNYDSIKSILDYYKDKNEDNESLY